MINLKQTSLILAVATSLTTVAHGSEHEGRNETSTSPKLKINTIWLVPRSLNGPFSAEQEEKIHNNEQLCSAYCREAQQLNSPIEIALDSYNNVITRMFGSHPLQGDKELLPFSPGEFQDTAEEDAKKFKERIDLWQKDREEAKEAFQQAIDAWLTTRPRP